MSTFRGDLFVAGELRSSSLVIPDATIVDADVALSAGIKAVKLEHQFGIGYSQADSGDVVSETLPIHTVRGVNASVVGFDVIVISPPAGGGDKKFTVDIKKASEASPSPVSILASPITVDDTKAAFQVVNTDITSPLLIAGETLEVVVTTSGSTGSQGQGVIVTTTIREDAD